MRKVFIFEVEVSWQVEHSFAPGKQFTTQAWQGIDAHTKLHAVQLVTARYTRNFPDWQFEITGVKRIGEREGAEACDE